MSARPSRERIALKAAQQVLASIPFQAEVKARLAKKTSRQDPTVADFDTAFAAELSHLTGQVLPRLFAQPGAITLVDQYRNYLAKSWLLHALDLASDDSMSPSALARKCKDILLREVFMSTQWMRAVVPLINFETDRGFRITGRYNDKLYVIKVKKPTYYVDPTTEGFYPRPPRDDFDPFLRTIGGFHQWLGIIDVQYERSTESFALIGTHEHYDLRRCFLLAMRLFGEGSIDGPFAYHSSENVYHAGGYSVHSNRQSVGLGNTYKFNMSRILGFRRMWHRVLGWFPTDKLPDRIQIGLRYFESSYYKLGVDRFLDLGIGLEALYGVEMEQSYRLPTRVACFLRSRGRRRIRLYDSMRSLWQLRNRIAHGAPKVHKGKSAKRVGEGVPVLRSIVRESLLQHIALYNRTTRHGKSYEDVIVKEFDKRFVLGR